MGESCKRKRDEWERDQEPEQGYPVEVITHARVNVDLADGWEYRVKWAGYDSDEDSWEPTKNVAACQRLLSSFWNEIGLDDNHYDHGYVFTASKKWIEMEQRRFKAEAEQPVKQTVVAQTAAGKRGRSVAERKSLASVQLHGASAPVHRFSRSPSPYRLIHASASILASPTEKSRLLSSAHNLTDHVHPENLQRESKLPSRVCLFGVC
ncbi:hypothetical protein B0H10DRAFT_2120255 [Mycena sp. CBHHK59/15]|nr:hypothetical protein B0H10DRAFT_2120255 [Mycena sp. CBHHK59/15]